MVRAGFGMPWPLTLYGALLVLRANQVWAPAEHDETYAIRLMRSFYALLARARGARFDPGRAAELEVAWWRAHRQGQHGGSRDAPPDTALVDALAELYAYVYDASEETVRGAAQERADAMRISDRWVVDGRDPRSPALAEELAALVRSYAAPLAAVHR